MIENGAGELPFWLMPTQVKIVATDPKAIGKAKKIALNLSKFRVYSELYLAHRGKIKADTQIPLTLVIGNSELKSGAVKVLQKNCEEVTISVKKLLQVILKSKEVRNIHIPKIC